MVKYITQGVDDGIFSQRINEHKNLNLEDMKGSSQLEMYSNLVPKNSNPEEPRRKQLHRRNANTLLNKLSTNYIIMKENKNSYGLPCTERNPNGVHPPYYYPGGVHFQMSATHTEKNIEMHTTQG